MDRTGGFALVLLLACGCDQVFGLTARDSADPQPAQLMVLAQGEIGASELVVDGAEVFWTIGGAGGAIRGCAIAACEPRSLTTIEVSPRSLVVDGAQVLWGSQSALRRVDRAATAAAPTTLLDDNFQVHTLRHVLSRIWWSSSRGFSRCNYDASLPTCDASATISELAKLDGPVAVNANNRMWGAGVSAVFEVDVTNLGGVKHTFPADAVRAIAASSSNVFAFRDAGTDLLAWSVAAADLTAPTVIPTGAPVMAIAADEQFLYVASADGRILRVPTIPQLGAPETVAGGLPAVQAIALVGDRIYVVANGQIAWLPVP